MSDLPTLNPSGSTISPLAPEMRNEVMAGTGAESPSLAVTCGDSCPVELVSSLDLQSFLARLNLQDP